MLHDLFIVLSPFNLPKATRNESVWLQWKGAVIGSWVRRRKSGKEERSEDTVEERLVNGASFGGIRNGKLDGGGKQI